jgi:hypothetical protein
MDKTTLDFLALSDLCWRPAVKERLASQAVPIDVRLQREGIYHFDELIHLQSKDWLLKQFGPGKDYPVKVNQLMKNIIWQIRDRIVRDKQEPFEGLLRGFWYAYIKPALARSGSLNTKIDQYPQMIKSFVRLVQACDLMRYAELGFTDDNANDRKIGINNHVILFAEKTGHFPMLQRISQDLDITILSLGGQPSLLSAEYFVNEMKAAGIDIRKSFYTFSLVDYDPSGGIIKDAFLNDLEFYGLKHIQHAELILPDIFSKEEIELSKYPLPQPKEMLEKNRKWLKETNGIDGKLFGLEADACPTSRIDGLVKAQVNDLIESTESIRKGRAMLAVVESLNAYILARLQTES